MRLAALAAILLCLVAACAQDVTWRVQNGGAQIYEVFPVIGDSNNYFGSPLDSSVDKGHARLYEYPPQNGAGGSANTLHLALDPFGWYEYAWSTDPNAHIGYAGAFFRDYYLPNNPTSRAVVVPYARGGSTLVSAGNWLPPSGTLLVAATSLSNTALTTAQGMIPQSVMKGALIQVGTNDLINARPANEFRSHLYQLIDALRSQLTNGTNLPVVVGGLPHDNYATNPGGVGGTWNNATSGSDYRTILSTVGSKFAFVAYADSESPSNLGATSFHFTAAEQRAMAGRYWTAWQAAVASSAPAFSWDANDHGTNLTVAAGAYANSDVTAGATAVWNSVRATRGRNGGKYYFEVQVSGTTSNRMVGLCDAGQYTDTYLASGTNSGNSASYWAGQANAVTGWTKDWTATPAGAWANGDVVMIAVDFSSGKAWVGRNGVWGNSGDPAAGTGSWIHGIAQTVWPCASLYQNSGALKLRRTSGEFSYSIPAGFSAWGS